MFLGRFVTTFSGRNRLVLPKRFRQEIHNNEIYLIKGFDGGIWGFNTTGWDKEANKRLYDDLRLSEGRKNRRDFFSNADSSTLDEQGRFIISDDLVKETALKNQIILIGAGDHFEIWNLSDWEKLK